MFMLKRRRTRSRNCFTTWKESRNRSRSMLVSVAGFSRLALFGRVDLGVEPQGS